MDTVFCGACGGGEDEKKILLCDSCPKGYHIYCLKPKLRSIPKGDWFCPTCKDKHDGKDEEEEEEDEEEEEYYYVAAPQADMETVFCNACNGGEDENKIILCDGCPKGFHTYCLKPKLR